MFLNKKCNRGIKKWLFAVFFVIVALFFSDAVRIARYHIWFNTNLLTLPLTPKQDQELDHILSQQFTYLDAGKASQVFVSEDGQFVIKLFRKRILESKSKKNIPLLGRFATYRKSLRLQFQLYRACLNAHKLLAHGTGSIYYHLAPTHHFNKKVTLYDQSGNLSFLDLDKESYYIQKKAVIAEDLIKRSIDSGDLDQAKKTIAGLLDFSFLLYRQGIVIFDLQPKNFGFIEETAVKIDIEHLGYKPARVQKFMYYYDRHLKGLRHWIELHCPSEFLNFFDLKVQMMKEDQKRENA